MVLSGPNVADMPRTSSVTVVGSAALSVGGAESEGVAVGFGPAGHACVC